MDAKIKEILGSQNFLIAILSIVLLSLKANGLIDEDVQAESFLDALKGNVEWVFLFVITPVVKLVKKFVAKEWTWDFFKNSNFIAFMSSIIMIVVGSFVGEDVAATLMAIVTNLLNITYQASLPPKYVKQ